MKKYKVIKDDKVFKLGEIVTFVGHSNEDANVSYYINEKGYVRRLFNNLAGGDCQVEAIEEGTVIKFDNKTDRTDYHKGMEKLYFDNYELFVEKNRKYGNSFQDTFRELGQISALTRMTDKFNRLTTMMLSAEVDNEESVRDTLVDLANYCLMTVYEIDNKEKQNGTKI